MLTISIFLIPCMLSIFVICFYLEVYYNVCLYFKDFEERECIVAIFSGMVLTRLPAGNYLVDTLSPFIFV